MISQEEFLELLQGLPVVHLELLSLVSQLMGADGQPDPEKIAFHYIELEKAISEAEAYVRQTREMVQCLLERLR
jgi:hypothetical protein